MKKILVCLLAIGLLAGAASMAAADDGVTIRFWSGSLDKARMGLAVPMFAKIRPDIKVEYEFVSPGNMADKVTLSAAAGDPPNVIFGYAGRSIAWWHQDLLESLNGTLTQEEIDDFVPGILDLYTIDGELASYPIYHDMIAYIVNKTLLEEAGAWDLIPESREVTYDTLMKIAELVNDPPNVYAFCFFATGKGGDYYMLDYFKMFGANQYEGGDYTHTTLNSDAGVKALEWMIDMIDRGYSPPGAAGMSSKNYADLVGAGKIAMHGHTAAGASEYSATIKYESKIADRVYEYAVVQTPHVEGVLSPGLFPSPTNITVFKEEDPAKREAAIAFAKFLISPEFMAYSSTISKSFPTRKSVSTEILEDPNYKFAMENVSRVGMADLGMNSPHYLEVRLARFPELQAAFMGTKTAKEALDDFAKAVEEMWE